MKKYIFSSIILIIISFTSKNINAQQTTNIKNNYVVLSRKVPQLQPIILTAEALKVEDGENFGDFQVIICGKEIGDIIDSKKINKFIKKPKKQGYKL